MSGFFSSTSLAISAQGITELIQNEGNMKLLCSAKLSPEDLKSIEFSNENPEKFIEDSFLNDLSNLEEGFVKDHVEALGWMLANGFLEIKIAIPTNDKGIFHSKIGILVDSDRNMISFSGSDNETAYGWLYNIEEFKVFCSWDKSEKKFVEADYNDFNKYWGGDTNKTNIIDLPEAIKNSLIELAPSNKNDLPLLNKKKFNSNFKLRSYQKEALESWKKNRYKGLFEMATGTGKTFTALSCLKELSDSKDRLLTVIACPQSHLIDQWIKDVKKIHNGPIITASSMNNKWKKDLKKLMKDLYLGIFDKAVVMTTQASLSSEYFLSNITRYNGDSFLIVDEVHGIGSSKQRLGLNNCYKYRLGLSATPERWFDDEGTQFINDYFDGVIFEFGIEKALNEINPDTGKPYLTPYTYHPIITDLNDDELENYHYYSLKLAQALGSNKIEDSEKITSLAVARQNIINNAESKYSAFKKILHDNPNIDKLIVFCSHQQIDKVQNILNECGVYPQHRFTHKESSSKNQKELFSEREKILKNFEEGYYKALVAMKCLDEGVDVPSAETAIIMSSTSNPREHVQRRGRILRNSPGKEKAVIYDILIFPEEPVAGSNIMKKEIKRYEEFAKNAENSYECLKILENYYYKVV